MTDEEIETKAKEYAEEKEKRCFLGVYDNSEDLHCDEAYNNGYIIGIEEGYIAGAKENQPNAEEMIKRLLKGGYIKTGISEVKENLVFHNLIKNPNDLPKNDNKILFFAKDISCVKNHYLNRYSLGNYDTIDKLFVANSPGYSKDFAITDVLYWWELAE